MVGRTDCGSTPDASHSPVLHRTHVVVHHSHGVPVEPGAHHHLQHVLIPELVVYAGINEGPCGRHSHNPYPCDGEGGQADGQDDPGGHWAGRGLALSGAWGEMGAVARSGGDTAGGIRQGGGRGGSLTHRDTHRRGGGMRGKEGGMVRPFRSAGPCDQLQPDKQDVHEKSTFTQTHHKPATAAGSDPRQHFALYLL